MFGHEKLFVYKRARDFNLGIRAYLRRSNLDYPTEDQLRRAGLSVVLNISEGNGKFTNPDRRRFLIMSRSSLLECAAILDILYNEKSMSKEVFADF